MCRTKLNLFLLLLAGLFSLAACTSTEEEGSDDPAVETVEHWKKGVDLYEKGEMDKALRELRMAVEIEPTNHKARFDLVQVLFAKGVDHERKKMEFLIEAGKLEEKEKDARRIEKLRKKADAEREEQKQYMAEAGEHLLRLRKAWPHVWNVPHLLGYVYLVFEQYDAARASFKTAMRIYDPKGEDKERFERVIEEVEQARFNKEMEETDEKRAPRERDFNLERPDK